MTIVEQANVAGISDRSIDPARLPYEHAEEITFPHDEQQRKAEALADSLAGLAAFVRSNPQLSEHLEHTSLGGFTSINIPVGGAVDQRATVAAFARAALRAGAAVTKRAMGIDGHLFGIDIKLGRHRLSVYGDRDEVCERVVTGTREVTEEVPDPTALAAVPKTTVTRTEEVVEWRCGSLLAPAATGVIGRDLALPAGESS